MILADSPLLSVTVDVDLRVYFSSNAIISGVIIRIVQGSLYYFRGMLDEIDEVGGSEYRRPFLLCELCNGGDVSAMGPT